ncbi:MAG TPA: tryptophan synthase subunit alpha [Longimicrobiales bacterium]|nr:tryptophan synthase subunit alpha [Longimicrobiales bacterium]
MKADTIASAFSRRRDEGRAALVPYVTAGHPTHDATANLLEALAGAGADVLELGIPFSDPLADGPTIQRSSFQALSQGATVAGVLEDLGAFRTRRATPVVLFTYLNPILRYGLDAFLSDAVEAGAQGLLVTDLPQGADPALEGRIRASGLDLIRLVAPTTEPERVTQIAAGGSGFLYYISRTGVTGARTTLRATLGEEVGRIRGAVRLPVAVGFGISTPEQAGAVAAVADGVVVGSALIRALDEGGIEGGARFVASLREGMDAR